MQKIAIPVLDHKLSPYFASSLLFKIFLVEDQAMEKGMNTKFCYYELSEQNTKPSWRKANRY